MVMAKMSRMAILRCRKLAYGKIGLETILDENDDNDNVDSRLTGCRPSQLRERVLLQKCNRANANVMPSADIAISLISLSP